MKVAIVGATSQIAKDLILSFTEFNRFELLLYARNLQALSIWIEKLGLNGICTLHHYDQYGELPHDVVINFVGVGDPKQAVEMGAAIINITSNFDDKIIASLENHPQRRYIFLSSGAVYGHNFSNPVTDESESYIPINNISTQDFYSIAKIYAEVKHRARPGLSIVDLRVFNYFSRSQNINARFLISDIARSLRDKQTFLTSSENIARDYLHPEDLHQLIIRIILSPAINCSVDCYSKSYIDKHTLLKAMNRNFGLDYKFSDGDSCFKINATGAKPNYYSLNRKAENFNYYPKYTSLDGVFKEMAAILDY